ncbi:MAG: hypothetical protein JEY96_08975 [Bacteroidales bacterium]|nr:hypothetical protein [Bacteroidales bacterium]
MDNFEVIEKYIDGELEGSELINFEKLLSTDDDIKHNYNLSLEINNSIKEDDVIALRETMNYMYNEEETKVRRIPTVFAKRKVYYAAASIALLVATGGIVQKLAHPDLDNNAVYEKYYAPYDATVTYRSGNTEVDRILLKALERYEDRDFENALVLFEEVVSSHGDDMSVKLYTGISYMEEEKYQKASTSFSKIIVNNDNLFIEQAKWYLSMCYIKTGSDNDAVYLLKELINEQSTYTDKANKVLRDIEN